MTLICSISPENNKRNAANVRGKRNEVSMQCLLDSHGRSKKEERLMSPKTVWKMFHCPYITCNKNNKMIKCKSTTSSLLCCYSFFLSFQAMKTRFGEREKKLQEDERLMEERFPFLLFWHSHLSLTPRWFEMKCDFVVYGN